uniref:Uncharacterized protein n=1 Tax=Cynoglossus semilaevis TaxID=244447 RepID=A0A3P8WPZ7_CYNSE
MDESLHRSPSSELTDQPVSTPLRFADSFRVLSADSPRVVNNISSRPSSLTPPNQFVVKFSLRKFTSTPGREEGNSSGTPAHSLTSDFKRKHLEDAKG